MRDPERSGRPLAVTVALFFAVLAGVVAIFSIWANDQLLDEGSWASVSGHLLESGQVRHRVAVYLGQELAAETEAPLDAAGGEALAEEVMPTLHAEQTELAERVMKTQRFKRIWVSANREGQRALVRVLDEEESGREGGVYVDLTPALRQLAAELGETREAQELGAGDLAAAV